MYVCVSDPFLYCGITFKFTLLVFATNSCSIVIKSLCFTFSLSTDYLCDYSCDYFLSLSLFHFLVTCLLVAPSAVYFRFTASYHDCDLVNM